MNKFLLLPLATALSLSGLRAADQNAEKPSEPQATPVKATTKTADENATTSPSAKASDKEQSRTTNTKPLDGVKFAKKAALAGMEEIETGKLAVAQGGNAKVKEFGQMMITQHTELADKLKAIAAKEKIELPAKLDDKHQKQVDQLASLQGAAFDSAYVPAMVAGHQKAVALFKDAAANCTNPELKKFAAANLPILEMHLKHAQTLQKDM